MKSLVRRLVLARFVSDAGSTAALFVGVWGKASFRLHASPGQMALSSAVWGVAAIAGSILGGVLVDRFNPRRVLLAAEVIAIPATLALVAAESMPVLIAMMLPASFAGAIIGTAVGSFAPFVVEDESQLQKVNASIEMAFALSFVAGPAAGSFIAKSFGLDWIFVLNAVTSVIALLLILGVHVRVVAQTGHQRQHHVLRDAREGVLVAVRDRNVRLAMIIVLGAWLSFGGFMALEPLFYREVLHSGPALLGWVLAVFGAGTFAGAALAQKFPPRLVSLTGLTMMAALVGVGEVVYTGTEHLPLVLAGNVVWGVAIGSLGPVARTIIQGCVPETHVGRVMGTLGVAQRLGQLAPLTFIGAVAAVVGVQRVLVGAGVVLIAFSASVYVSARNADRAHYDGTAEALVPVEPEPIGRGTF